MKILLVTESYWPNADGGALFERRLVQGMIDRGHKVWVWAPSKNFRSHTEHDGDSVIFREQAYTLPFNKKYKVSFWPSLHTRRAFGRSKPDVVHIHNPFMLGRTAMAYANRHGIPVVATNHLMPENFLLNLKGSSWYYGWFYKRFWHYLVRFHNRAQFVTTPTPTALQFLHQFGLKAPAKAVTNGIDMDVFHPGIATEKLRAKLGLPKKPIILYLGRVDGEKRIDIIIRSLPKLLKQLDCQLVIAGFGVALEPLKKLAAELKVAEQVTFTGYLDEADKPGIYNLADVFVISSPAELQSIVTLEAMASAKPVVSVDVAALHELVHDGKNGYLFAENNHSMLAEKLANLLSEPKKLAAFGKESLAIVAKHHSTQVTFNEYEGIYKQVNK
jgi:glycosyltransferase involved in cell wall biosynthesis